MSDLQSSNTRDTHEPQPNAANKVGDSLRERLREIAPDKAELVVTALTEALQARKSAWGNCSTCSKAVKVEIQDSTAAVNAFKALLEATEGRPGVAGEVGPTVIVRVISVASGRDGSDSLRERDDNHPLDQGTVESNLRYLLTGPNDKATAAYRQWARAWLEQPAPTADELADLD